jgi:DNA phosphorothioation-dependent restriction protein DptG
MDSRQSSVITGLCELADKKPHEKNSISAYLPYRNKGADFDLDYVAGALVGISQGVKLPDKFDIDELRQSSLHAIQTKTAGDPITHCIEDIYFSNDSKNLKELSPHFKLLCTGKSRKEITSGSRHLELILGRFLAKENKISPSEQNHNIFEKIILDQFCASLEKDNESRDKEPEAYLPFIADFFAQDFGFLLQHPSYFIEQARNFLNLYAFLYCSQLALNIKEWEIGAPEVKPLHFVLDTEKCSTERKAANSYKDLLRSVGDVFPVLTMLEVLNEELYKAGTAPLPIWKIFKIINNSNIEDIRSVCDALDCYTREFIAVEKPGRNLKPRNEMPSASIQEKLKLLFRYAIDQFDLQRLNEKDTRYQMKEKYKAPFEKEVAQHFAQSRGRLGKILVMNQDYILLLTNLAIGGRESIRLQEVLQEFKKRGVYFDKQSELKLITFYERIGNIARMSDSGDAVYVRPTV